MIKDGVRAGAAPAGADSAQHRRWIFAPLGTAVATAAVAFGLAVLALDRGDDGGDTVLASDVTGQLLAAPDWAHCDRLPTRPDALVDRLPSITDPVAVALCVRPVPFVDTVVWVAGPVEARSVWDDLEPVSDHETVSCGTDACHEIRFALRDVSGDVLELTLVAGDGRTIINAYAGQWSAPPDFSHTLARIAATGLRYEYDTATNPLE